MEPLREHLVRSIPTRDLSYWFSSLTNDGWRLLAMAPGEQTSIAVFERSLKTLTWRLHDEIKYARSTAELGEGLRQLVGGAPRATMPAARVETHGETRVVLTLELAGAVLDTLELSSPKESWPLDGISRILLFADNLLDVFKIPESAIREALRGDEPLENLLVLLSGRAIIQGTPSGRTLQITRGDLVKVQQHLPQPFSGMLTLQATKNPHKPWILNGNPSADPAHEVVKLLPGCVANR